MYISMLVHVSVLYIVSISRHVCVYAYVCVCICNILTYMHTRMVSFLFIMLCKFVNKIYIISHHMRKIWFYFLSMSFCILHFCILGQTEKNGYLISCSGNEEI